MSTCTDNRLRVWDNLYAGVEAPTREIVHSQDFNRYLTPFRAVWDPKVCVCPRPAAACPRTVPRTC